jgi:hypothetical protein
MSYVFKFNLLPSYLIIRHLFWRQDCWAPCAVIGPQIRRGFKPAIIKKNYQMKTIVNYATSLQKKGISVVDRNVPDPEPDPYLCVWASWIRSRNYLYGSGSFHQLAKTFNKNLDLCCLVTYSWIFIFEDWCKWAYKKVMRKILFKNLFFVGILEVNDEKNKISAGSWSVN